MSIHVLPTWRRPRLVRRWLLRKMSGDIRVVSRPEPALLNKIRDGNCHRFLQKGLAKPTIVLVQLLAVSLRGTARLRPGGECLANSGAHFFESFLRQNPDRACYGVETVQLVRTRRQVVYGVCFLVHRRNSSCRSRPAIIKVPVRVHVRIDARGPAQWHWRSIAHCEASVSRRRG